MDVEPLTVTATRDGRRCILTITGELDLTTAADLFPAVIGVVGALNGQTDQLVLDLAELTSLDIGGARALMTVVHTVSEGRRVTVRSISAIASRLFELLDWNLEAPQHAGTIAGP